MKRTKEEVMLNEWIDKYYGYDRPKHMKVLRLITVLVRAVREDCAKVAENTSYKMCDGCARHLAAAIQGRGK